MPRNPQDATLRNIRAAKARDAKINKRLSNLEEWVRLLRRRLRDKKR